MTLVQKATSDNENVVMWMQFNVMPGHVAERSKVDIVVAAIVPLYHH